MNKKLLKNLQSEIITHFKKKKKFDYRQAKGYVDKLEQEVGDTGLLEMTYMNELYVVDRNEKLEKIKQRINKILK